MTARDTPGAASTAPSANSATPGADSATPTGSAGPAPSPALPVGPRGPVWAPSASRVGLVVVGQETTQEVDMLASPTHPGWWVAPYDLDDGTRYLLRPDHGPALPDPRSALQPEGVDGPSQVVDTTAWDRTLWTDTGRAGRELVGSVVYELHVGTFTPAGTLDGVIDLLPYMADLGVDMV